MPSEALHSSAPSLPVSWEDLGAADLWSWPLATLERPLDRWLTRAFAALARHQVRCIDGWERVLPECDPFILVANHGSRREALYLPAALMLARGGRPVHFLADWNFRLIPGVGYLYDASGVITVARKPARPRWLTRFRSRFASEQSPFEQAAARLVSGGSVAIFPEGRVNRNPHRLLRGRYGAARLSLETGVPILPVGIRPAGHGCYQRPSSAPMNIQIGAPLHPGPAQARAELSAVRAWHLGLMSAIAALSGKDWSPADKAARREPPDTGVT